MIRSAILICSAMSGKLSHFESTLCLINFAKQNLLKTMSLLKRCFYVCKS